MNATSDVPGLERHRIPFGSFFVGTSIQVALAVGIYAVAAPDMLRAEVAMPGWVLVCALLCGVPMSLFEYLYHRYMLHSAVLPFMASMHAAHSYHHKVTSVKAPILPKEPARLVPVVSRFPIASEPQEVAAMFPSYALSIFYGVFLVSLGLPGKLLMPAAPVLLGVILATTLYLCGYEMWHAVLHMPYERYWRPILEGRRTGRIGRYVYGFHLMHHWRPTCNLAVVGLWGVAVWDHLFRTHRRPEHLPLDGGQVSYDDAALGALRWPIRVLDGWRAGLYRWSRSVEQTLARIFLRRDQSFRA